MSMDLITKKDYEFCLITSQLKENIEKSYLQLGKNLLEIRDNAKWKGGWESWHDFLAEIMKMDDAKASRLISIYQKFVIWFQIPEDKVVEAGGWSVVAQVLPFCDTKENATEWLDKCTLLSPGDLKKEISEKRTGVMQQICACDQDYFLMKVCGVCHKRIKILDKEQLTEENLAKLR